jgi:transcription factor MBP1
MTKIRSASYSGTKVYELVIRGVPVMRRAKDSFINATQVLRAAGLPKPARTKVLEKQVSRGMHQKVQGGYAGFQGTWVPLDIAVELADAHGIVDELRELTDYDVESGLAEKDSPPIKVKKQRLNSSSSSEGFCL